MVFSGAALPVVYGHLKVIPLGPAGRAAEGTELGCGAPGATYGSTAGLDVVDHVSMSHHILEQVADRSWSPRKRPTNPRGPLCSGRGAPGGSHVSGEIVARSGSTWLPTAFVCTDPPRRTGEGVSAAPRLRAADERPQARRTHTVVELMHG